MSALNDLGHAGHTISIPARDLTGSRVAKLAQLDQFIAQLLVVRLALDDAAADPADLRAMTSDIAPARGRGPSILRGLRDAARALGHGSARKDGRR